MNDRVRQRKSAARRRRRWRLAIIGAAAVVAALSVALVLTRNSPGDDGPELSAAAQRGKDSAVRFSCVGCHGRNGEGGNGVNGVGPAWQGLYLSERLLEDGTTVLADEAYLVESIIDPQAKQVAGWTNRMPMVAVPDAVVADMIAYMKELDSPTVDTVTPTAAP